jgi:hypothetical protein
MLTNGKDTMHKLTKAQYGDLVREIQKAIKKHAMKGGGMYDFAPAETYVDQLPEIPFYVHVEGMAGGGKTSLRDVARRVLKAQMVNKAGKATVSVGKKAIDKLADEAEKRGVPEFVTNRVGDVAKKALEKSEGSIKGQLDKAATKMESKLGLDGDGITLKDVASVVPAAAMGGFAIPALAGKYLMGRGMQPAGSGLMQTGHGMRVSGSGHYHGGASGFVTRSSATPGIPAGSMQVGFSNHISSRMPAGGY